MRCISEFVLLYHSTKAHSFTKTEICDMLLIKRIKKDKNCEKYIIQKDMDSEKGRAMKKKKDVFLFA